MKKAKETIELLLRQRYALARLAAETPQFFNPIDAMSAEQLRELVLNDPDNIDFGKTPPPPRARRK